MIVNLKEKSVEELKALAYDLLVQQTVTNNNLQMVEREIANKLQELQNQHQQSTEIVVPE